MEWTHKLFIEHSDLFLKIFRLRHHGTLGGVEGLAEIFAGYRVPGHWRVLDLACGIGRHEIPLATRGFTVVGLDLSPVFVKRALSLARKKGWSALVRWIQTFLEGRKRKSSPPTADPA